MSATSTFLDFPFGIDVQGRTATTADDDHIRDMIKLVLFTEPGERVNRPDFGSGLKQLLFAPSSDALVAAVEALVHGALIRWLDTVITVEAVDVQAGEATLEIDITYARIDTGERRFERFVRQTTG
ncbi:GPW/gp25 family protein [Sinorhizobium sp. BG8]|uniref:GPW/gp25 family protein n=1 Tax=Sinorhizobium sp. BG8 TaxID=2613773 RepID=UPI00193DBB9D|nr:GPW/gp25 family protein [Sinorhizobium sp. BG8]QRM54369.1 GPW/gp25 family protein [Sinorhizobium sp. BG8]